MCQIYASQPAHRYGLQSRRIRLNGQSTTVRLENAFWSILDALAIAEGLTTPGFISKLHAEAIEIHGEPENFSSVLRCTCLLALETDTGLHRMLAAE